MLLLRSIVPGEQLTLALTQDEVRINGASLAGPALAGALYGLHHVAPSPSPPPLSSSPSPRPPSSPRGSPAPRLTRRSPAKTACSPGIRELWDQPFLRAAVLLIMGVNTVGSGLDLVVIVILRHQAVPAYAIGLALGTGAVGGLAGAPLVKPCTASRRVSSCWRSAGWRYLSSCSWRSRSAHGGWLACYSPACSACPHCASLPTSSSSARPRRSVVAASSPRS